MRAGGYMKNTNSSNGNLLPNKVNIKLDVLRPTMLNRIGREIYGADVVTVNNSGSVHRMSQFLQKMIKPTCLSNDSSHPTVFSLCTRARNSGLPARRPRHQVITQVHTKSRSRPSCIRTSRPI